MRKLVERIIQALPGLLQPFVLYLVSANRRWLVRATHNRVVVGPFKGMQYVHRAVGSSLYPKLLGTYEKELWPIVDQAIAHRYHTMINVGAGEGYYAVGFARRSPQARIICFEAALDQHYLLRTLIRKNDAGKHLAIYGCCTTALLHAILAGTGDTLIICDVDGAEEQLMDPQVVPRLSHVDLLVEVHDHRAANVSTTLKQRFSPTHTITAIPSRLRDRADWPLEQERSWPQQAKYLNEGRVPLQWYWMVSKRLVL